MSDIVNLRTLRKQKDRAAARARGTEASAKSGRSRGQKASEAALAEKEARDLDGKLRDGRRGELTED